MPRDETASGVRAAAKPKWFTPITVSAIVLGSLFGCCGATTIAGHLANRMSPAAIRLPDVSADDAAVRVLTERNAAFQAQVFPYAVAAGTLGMVHSLALLAAGILAYRRREIGRKLLVLACVIGLPVELVGSAVGLYVAKHTSAYTADLMKASLEAQRSKNADQAVQNPEKVASIASKMTTILGLGFALVWFVFKAGYYVACVLYLRRKDVAQYFEPAPG